MIKIIPAIAALAALTFSINPALAQDAKPELDTGDTAWIMPASCA